VKEEAKEGETTVFGMTSGVGVSTASRITAASILACLCNSSATRASTAVGVSRVGAVVGWATDASAIAASTVA
jgi:hypothetical protein